MSYPCPLAKSVVTAVVTSSNELEGEEMFSRDNCFHRLLLRMTRDCYFHSSGKSCCRCYCCP